MSEREKSILIGSLWAVILALLLALAYDNEKAVVNSLSPEQRAEFSSFRTKMRNLQANDFVDMTYESKDGMTRVGTFIVVGNDGRDDLTLLGPGPGSNPEIHRMEVGFFNPREARDLFFRVKGIKRQRDPGWQATHEWFALQ